MKIVEAGFAGRALQSKAAGAAGGVGGGREDGWQREREREGGGVGIKASFCFLISFFLFLCYKLKSAFATVATSRTAGEPAPSTNSTDQYNNWLQDTADRKKTKPNASTERINSGESQAEARSMHATLRPCPLSC